MRWNSLIWIVFTTALPGADYNNILSSDNQLLGWDQYKCDNKTVHYSKNTALSQLLGGETTMNYDLKKNTTSDTVSMGAQYSFEQFSAKLQGSYIKDKFDNNPSVGKTNLLVQYHQKLWDSLALNASENVTLPLNETDPMKYTSMLKALYPLNDGYNIFAEGSYTLLDTPASEGTLYRNPYSYTTGVNYADGTDTAIKASYILVQDTYPTLGTNKKIKLAHNHKINKKMKTSFSLTKTLETDQPDNKASFDVIYAF